MGHVGKAGERGITGAREMKWCDCVLEDRRVFGITGH